MTGTATMTALRAHRRGGPEVLVVEEAPVPVPGRGELLVAVRAAAITFDELLWEETWLHGGADRTPIIPSHEFAGDVAVVGPGVTGVAVGDSVYGTVPFDRDGAAAEFVVVPAGYAAAKPRTLTYVEAAAVPLPALTARQALFDQAHLKAGERVLVLGATGGVGGYAVQLAASAGADVTATARHALDYVRELGAHRVIDVRSADLGAETARYDVVIDTVGGEILDRSYGLVRAGGRLVTLQAPPDAAEAERRGITATFFIVETDAAQLDRLTESIDRGGLRVTVAVTFSLRDGATAYASRPRGLGPGKTVLIV